MSSHFTEGETRKPKKPSSRRGSKSFKSKIVALHAELQRFLNLVVLNETISSKIPLSQR